MSTTLKGDVFVAVKRTPVARAPANALLTIVKDGCTSRVGAAVLTVISAGHPGIALMSPSPCRACPAIICWLASPGGCARAHVFHAACPATVSADHRLTASISADLTIVRNGEGALTGMTRARESMPLA